MDNCLRILSVPVVNNFLVEQPRQQQTHMQGNYIFLTIFIFFLQASFYIAVFHETVSF